MLTFISEGIIKNASLLGRLHVRALHLSQLRVCSLDEGRAIDMASAVIVIEDAWPQCCHCLSHAKWHASPLRVFR